MGCCWWSSEGGSDLWPFPTFDEPIRTQQGHFQSHMGRVPQTQITKMQPHVSNSTKIRHWSFRQVRKESLKPTAICVVCQPYFRRCPWCARRRCIRINRTNRPMTSLIAMKSLLWTIRGAHQRQIDIASRLVKASDTTRRSCLFTEFANPIRPDTARFAAPRPAIN